MAARLAPATLLAGLGAGVSTVAVYQWWWGLLLSAVVTLLVLVLTPPGWGTRLPFAVGNAIAVTALSLPRAEGDYFVTSSAGGYTVLALALVVLTAAIATLPRPARRGASNTAELPDQADRSS